MTFLAELREGLKISWSAIWANKLRSTLTTLGVVIGILTVSLMATAIEGLHRKFLESVSGLGADVFYIERFPWERVSNWWKLRNRRDFTIDYGPRLAREANHALAVSVEASINRSVKYQNRSADSVWIVGNNEHSALVRGLTVKEGRFLSGAEVDGARPVCVLGAEVAERFFSTEPALGKRIKIADGSYEIIGVLDKFGPFIFGNMDDQIIIPITRFVSEMTRRPYVFMMVKVRDLDQMEDAREELRGIMRKIRRVLPGEEDDFSINQQEQIVNTFERVGGTIALAGMFITGLSLFVGGIGIMNIMFVSVAERTREIGIRKAIGAKRRTILTQFLIEAASICLLGGLVGLALAFPASLFLKKHLPASLSPSIVGLALGVAVLTGVVSGLLPALRAARLNPVDALRSE